MPLQVAAWSSFEGSLCRRHASDVLHGSGWREQSQHIHRLRQVRERGHVALQSRGMRGREFHQQHQGHRYAPQRQVQRTEPDHQHLYERHHVDGSETSVDRSSYDGGISMKRPQVNQRQVIQQNGIALVSALLILVLLSAIAVGLVLTSNTETSVNANYRQERALDFAARAGIEEVRDRMAPATLNTLAGPGGASAPACLAAVPVVPASTNNGIL